MIALNVIGCQIPAFLWSDGGGKQTFPRLDKSSRCGVMMAQCFSADPGVLSKYNMDVQGCLCTRVLGDYLLKVIWDHSVPLIIPESIQHLHLFCCVHRSTSKTKAASAGKH